MAKVSTTLEYLDVEGDYGHVEGVQLTCDKCGNTAESAGTHEGSVGRCAYLLRETCPLKEINFYDTD